MLTSKRDPVAVDHDRVQRNSDSADGDYLARQVAASEAKFSRWYADLQYCVAHFHLLNNWECDFLLGVAGYRQPSAKQKDKLAVIIRKVELALTVSRRRVSR